MEKLIKKFGEFELYEIESTGINNTPYHTLEVRSTGIAKKHIIEIRLNRVNVAYNGEPVKHKFYDIYVSHGIRGETDTLTESLACANAIIAAVNAAFEIQKYCVLNGWWKES